MWLVDVGLILEILSTTMHGTTGDKWKRSQPVDEPQRYPLQTFQHHEECLLQQVEQRQQHYQYRRERPQFRAAEDEPVNKDEVYVRGDGAR